MDWESGFTYVVTGYCPGGTYDSNTATSISSGDWDIVVPKGVASNGVLTVRYEVTRTQAAYNQGGDDSNVGSGAMVVEGMVASWD